MLYAKANKHRARLPLQQRSMLGSKTLQGVTEHQPYLIEKQTCNLHSSLGAYSSDFTSPDGEDHLPDSLS